MICEIKPLEWEDAGPSSFGNRGETWYGESEISSYTVEYNDIHERWEWIYDIGDGGGGFCDSLEHGKKLSEQHYKDLIMSCLVVE